MTDIDTTLFITGEPIDTAIGECRFLTVSEYVKVSNDLNAMAMTKYHIASLLYEDRHQPEVKEFLRFAEHASLFDIVAQIPDIAQSYSKIFRMCFSEDSVKLINQGTFAKIRSLILKMNCIKEEQVNPNPEIQRALERSRRVKALEGGDIKFDDIVSSVAMGSGIPYREINNFTIYQLYMSFHRLGHFKNYDTSTLFATVAPPKGKIDSWSKHIDLFEEERHAVSREEFAKSTGSIFQ